MSVVALLYRDRPEACERRIREKKTYLQMLETIPGYKGASIRTVNNNDAQSG